MSGGIDTIRAAVAGARPVVPTERGSPAVPPVRPPATPAARLARKARGGVDKATLVRAGMPTGAKDSDKILARQIWEDCVPLTRGVPAGSTYVLRWVGDDLDGITRMAKLTRLRVGVMPWIHRDKAGKLHDLGRWPCLVAAYGKGVPKGLLRIWLEEDGSDQARVADPAHPQRALPAHGIIGDIGGRAIHLGAAGEGMTVAVTLECALSALRHAPGAVWAVDGMEAARRVDVPEGLQRLFLALWRMPGQGKARMENINRAGWHLSAGNKRELLLAGMDMPPLWSPAPGRPRALVEMEADLARWESEGGA